jgi:alpha-glucosidase
MAGLYLTLRGTPIMYYGEEIGMTNNDPKRKEDVKDPIGRVGWPKEKGRDGERTPMQWDESANAGFSKAKPWLPVPPSYKTHNVADELKDPDSILNFYRRVLALRHNEPALVEGDYVALNESDADILSYLRRYKNEAVIVVLNMSGKKQIASFDLASQGFSNPSAETLVTTFKAHPQSVSLSSVWLEPFSVYIGKIRK